MKNTRGLVAVLVLSTLALGGGLWMLGARHDRRWRAERGLPANY